MIECFGPSCRRPFSSFQALVQPPERAQPGPIMNIKVFSSVGICICTCICRCRCRFICICLCFLSLSWSSSLFDMLFHHLEYNWKRLIGSIFHDVDDGVVEGVLVLLKPVGQVVVDSASVVDNCKVSVLVWPSCNVIQVEFDFLYQILN